MEVHIRGEYWIDDGHVSYADQDIGDVGHEALAMNAVVSQYSNEIQNLADELDIDQSVEGYNGVDIYAVEQILDQAKEKLIERNMNTEQIHAWIMKYIGCNQEAYNVLRGNGSAAEYAIKYMNCVEVRENNVEFYGYNDQKRRSIVSGIDEILYSEGFEDASAEDVELQMEDRKTRKSWSTTLAELEGQHISPVSSLTPTNSYRSASKYFRVWPDKEENKYALPTKSAENPWKSALGREPWRATSECLLGFRSWVEHRDLQK